MVGLAPFSSLQHLSRKELVFLLVKSSLKKGGRGEEEKKKTERRKMKDIDNELNHILGNTIEGAIENGYTMDSKEYKELRLEFFNEIKELLKHYYISPSLF